MRKSKEEEQLDRDKFLQLVRAYVGVDPQVVPYIFKTIEVGMKDFVSEARTQASDYEVALAKLFDTRKGRKARLEGKFTKAEKFALTKIKHYEDNERTFYGGWQEIVSKISGEDK